MTPRTKRPGRVWIITPGTRADWFEAAQSSGADVALVDLEDSVAPSGKQAARDTTLRFFARPDAPCTLGLRMNSPATLEGVIDLTAIAAYPRKPDVILVPKVEAARDIEIVAGVLDTDEDTPRIWALIESPRAIDTLPSIVAAPRLDGVVFGSADYAAALGCGLGWESLLYARSALVNSANAVGLPAIDAPVYDLHDLDGLRREAELAKDLGFYGKGAVHPRQASVLHDVFTPTTAEIARARAIVAAARDSGGGITSVNGQMVGTPFFARAKALVGEVDG